MSEECRPGYIKESPSWEVEEVLDLKADFQKLLEVSKMAAKLAPGLKKGCRDLVEKYRLHEVLKVERQPGAVRLTLANLWRLIRCEWWPWLILHIFDLAEGRWREQDPAAITWRHYRNPRRRGFWSIAPLVYWEIPITFGSRVSPKPETLVPLVWPDLEIANYWGGRPDLYFSLLGAMAENLLYALGVREGTYFAKSLFGRFAKLPYELPTRAINSVLHRHIYRDMA